jgi:hypothetical protein
MTKVISPTPGRIVWFYPAPHDGIATLNNQPLAAIVAGVHSDHLVNLAIFDAYGNTQQRSNVTLVQPGEDAPNHAHATWNQAVEKVILDALTTGTCVVQKNLTPGASTYMLTTGTGVVQKATDPSAFFAETDGTSASEAGLVSEQITDSVAQSPAAGEAAPSSSEPAQA